MDFVTICKVWKLRDDGTAGVFGERVQTRAALMVEKPTGVEEVWKNFKECTTEEAIEVCGETQGMRRHKESRWWNEEIAVLVQEKRLFKLLKGPKKCRKGCRCEKTGRCKICRRGGKKVYSFINPRLPEVFRVTLLPEVGYIILQSKMFLIWLITPHQELIKLTFYLFFMFSRSRNPFLTFSQSCRVRVTSKI